MNIGLKIEKNNISIRSKFYSWQRVKKTRKNISGECNGILDDFFLIGAFSQKLIFFALPFMLSETQKNDLYNVVWRIRLTPAPSLLLNFFSILYHVLWYVLAQIKLRRLVNNYLFQKLYSWTRAITSLNFEPSMTWINKP